MASSLPPPPLPRPQGGGQTPPPPHAMGFSWTTGWEPASSVFFNLRVFFLEDSGGPLPPKQETLAPDRRMSGWVRQFPRFCLFGANPSEPLAVRQVVRFRNARAQKRRPKFPVREGKGGGRGIRRATAGKPAHSNIFFDDLLFKHTPPAH